MIAETTTIREHFRKYRPRDEQILLCDLVLWDVQESGRGLCKWGHPTTHETVEQCRQDAADALGLLGLQIHWES